MNNSVKHIAAAALILNATLALAWNPFDSKLQVYRCKDQPSAMACNTCERLDGKKMEFKVNVEKSTVMWVLYDNGEVKGTNALENCRVVDSKNWSCEVVPNYGDSSFHGSRQSMANGQYFSSSMIKLSPDSKSTQPQFRKGHFAEHFGCGK